MRYKFRGGVHPHTFKNLASDKSIKKPFIPKRVILPLSQHTGSPAQAVVAVGASVEVGDLIAKPSGRVSAAVHASIAGKVTRITYLPTYNQARVLSVVIESGENESQDFNSRPPRDVNSLSKEDLLGIIRDAGVVGLGGAAFPTDVKLSPPADKKIDALILNGAECEPYLTCDHRLMLEKTSEVLKGLEIIAKILGAGQAYIAIENNKIAAIYAIEKSLKLCAIERASRIGAAKGMLPKLAVLKEKYPQGAEKQIIKAVLNRVVPAGGLPMDVGCIVNNVGTAYAIYEAVYLGKPLIERAVTITGSCVKEPVNIWVRTGTLLSDLVNVFGGFKKEPKKVIMGGPMMGIAQYSMDTPISKGVSGVIFLAKNDIDVHKESVCIRCGRCVEACPMGLVPAALMYRIKIEDFRGAGSLGVENCYECGACSYICPAKIPLLDYLKLGKAKIRTV